MLNEAAERLRDLMRNALVGWDSRTLDGLRDGLDEALATERRATVDRIRAEVEGRTWPVDPFTGEPTESRIFTILDEAAA